jgi:hypothetical protein
MDTSQSLKTTSLSIWTSRVDEVNLFYCFHTLTVVLYVYAVGLYEIQRIK